jgi:uncharacterized membrane protein YhaH (DUF805 family)
VTFRDWVDPTRLYNPKIPANRAQYLWATIASVLFAFIVAVLLSIAYLPFGFNDYVIEDTITPISYLTAIVFFILASSRRLRHLGASGWLALLLLIPLVGTIMFLVLLLAPGKTKSSPGEIATSSKSETDMYRAENP